MENNKKKLFTITITTSISKYVFCSSCEKRTKSNFHPFIFPNDRELSWIELDRVVISMKQRLGTLPEEGKPSREEVGGREGERG